jgi:hypothetical protein
MAALIFAMLIVYALCGRKEELQISPPQAKCGKKERGVACLSREMAKARRHIRTQSM